MTIRTNRTPQPAALDKGRLGVSRPAEAGAKGGAKGAEGSQQAKPATPVKSQGLEKTGYSRDRVDRDKTDGKGRAVTGSMEAVGGGESLAGAVSKAKTASGGLKRAQAKAGGGNVQGSPAKLGDAKPAVTNKSVKAPATQTSVTNKSVKAPATQTSVTNKSVKAPATQTSVTNKSVKAPAMQTSVTNKSVKAPELKSSVTNKSVKAPEGKSASATQTTTKPASPAQAKAPSLDKPAEGAKGLSTVKGAEPQKTSMTPPAQGATSVKAQVAAQAAASAKPTTATQAKTEAPSRADGAKAESKTDTKATDGKAESKADANAGEVSGQRAAPGAGRGAQLDKPVDGAKGLSTVKGAEPSQVQAQKADVQKGEVQKVEARVEARAEGVKSDVKSDLRSDVTKAEGAKAEAIKSDVVKSDVQKAQLAPGAKTDGLARPRSADQIAKAQGLSPERQAAFDGLVADTSKADVAALATGIAADADLDGDLKAAVLAQRQSDVLQDGLAVDAIDAGLARRGPAEAEPFSQVSSSVAHDADPLDGVLLSSEERAQAASQGAPFVRDGERPGFDVALAKAELKEMGLVLAGQRADVSDVTDAFEAQFDSDGGGDDAEGGGDDDGGGDE